CAAVAMLSSIGPLVELLFPCTGDPRRCAPSWGEYPSERVKEMNEQEFQQKLGDLISQINALPEQQRSPLAQLASETRARHVRMKNAVSDLQESLDYLRLSIKYLVFDLEATRRENDYLRKLIAQHTKEPGTSAESDEHHGAD